MKTRLLFCLFLLMAIAVAHAQEDDPIQLDPVTVEAYPPVSPETTRQTIAIPEAAEPVISTVPDVLDKTSGLDIQSRGILTPKNSQVKIRGFDERRSLILLDGRPLNGTGVMGGQFVDWSSVAVDNWESVTVGKGAFSAKYGNTLGGTIDLSPVPIPEDFSFTARTGYKRYDTFSAGASAGGTISGMGLFLSGGWDETDGNLRNSGAERANINSRMSWKIGDAGEIYAAFRYTDGEFEMPVVNLGGAAGFDDDYPESVGTYLIGPGIKFPGTDRHGDGSYYTKERYEADLGVRGTVLGLDADVTVYFNHEDRDDVIYSYETGDLILKREATPDRSWGWTARFEKLLADHTIGFGADGNYQGYDGTEYTFIRQNYFGRPPTDGADESDATRWQGAYIDDQWVISEMLEFYFGLRYEDYTGDRQVDRVTGYKDGKPAGFETTTAKFDEETLLPKIGAVFRPVPVLAFHGRFARATRFPDNPAFYWYYGGYRPEVDPRLDVERKDLTYEDALQYEAGAEFTGVPGVAFRLNGYYYEVDDYIRWIFGYAPSRVVYNIDEVTFKGVEFDVEGKIYGDFYAFGNLTWQETRKKGDALDSSNDLTDELSELPEWKWNLGVKWHRDDGALAKLNLRWVDDREVPYLGTPGGAPFAGADAPDGTPVGKNVTLQNLDDFLTVDVLLKYPVWKKGFTGYLIGGVENLFDEEYQEEFGFPQPRQTFHIGAEIVF
ncbi:MAG: TonB-dependent receptor [Thermodesulfobacteriota bacterium]